jgi:hypothetical protein
MFPNLWFPLLYFLRCKQQLFVRQFRYLLPGQRDVSVIAHNYTLERCVDHAYVYFCDTRTRLTTNIMYRNTRIEKGPTLSANVCHVAGEIDSLCLFRSPFYIQPRSEACCSCWLPPCSCSSNANLALHVLAFSRAPVKFQIFFSSHM